MIKALITIGSIFALFMIVYGLINPVEYHSPSLSVPLHQYQADRIRQHKNAEQQLMHEINTKFNEAVLKENTK